MLNDINNNYDSNEIMLNDINDNYDNNHLNNLNNINNNLNNINNNLNNNLENNLNDDFNSNCSIYINEKILNLFFHNHNAAYFNNLKYFFYFERIYSLLLSEAYGSSD
jgi:hypothetical protein